MTRPTIASITSERDAINEKLRQSNDRHLEASLAFTRAASELKDLNSEGRWGMVILLLLMVKEISEPARYMLSYGNSWAYKVAKVAYPPHSLAFILFLGAGLLLPMLAVLCFQPKSKGRWRAACFAGWGLGIATFAFSSMAYVVKRTGLDAPQAIDQWGFAAVSCFFVILLMGASVNNEHNRRRTEKAQDTGNVECAASES